jgi:hypothetical protein
MLCTVELLLIENYERAGLWPARFVFKAENHALATICSNGARVWREGGLGIANNHSAGYPRVRAIPSRPCGVKSNRPDNRRDSQDSVRPNFAAKRYLGPHSANAQFKLGNFKIASSRDAKCCIYNERRYFRCNNCYRACNERDLQVPGSCDTAITH